MPQRAAGKSTLGACADLPLEAQLAERDGTGRAQIAERLSDEIDRVNEALASASPAKRKELILLVECLRAARQVVERSASFVNARDR